MSERTLLGLHGTYGIYVEPSAHSTLGHNYLHDNTSGDVWDGR